MTQASRISRLFLVAMLVVLAGAACNPAVAQTGGTLARVAPAELKLKEGERAQVQVLIQNAESVYTYQFVLIFDPALVEVVDADPNTDGVQVAPGNFLRGPTYVGINRADNGTGQVEYAITLLGQVGGRSGSGKLATATVKAKHNGTARFQLKDVKLTSADGAGLSVEVPAPTPTPLPSPRAGPSPTAGPVVPSLAIINDASGQPRVAGETPAVESESRVASFPPHLPFPGALIWSTLGALLAGYLIGRHLGGQR